MIEAPDLTWDAWLQAIDADAEAQTAASIDARMDYFLELLAEMEREDAHDAAVARARVDQINRWLEVQRERREKRTAYLHSQIELMADGYDFGRKKSRDLPHGVVGFRKKAASVEIVDKAAAIEWATVHCPEAIRDRASRDLIKGPLVDLVTSRGLYLDPSVSGLRFVDESESLYIKPRTQE